MEKALEIIDITLSTFFGNSENGYAETTFKSAIDGEIRTIYIPLGKWYRDRIEAHRYGVHRHELMPVPKAVKGKVKKMLESGVNTYRNYYNHLFAVN